MKKPILILLLFFTLPVLVFAQANYHVKIDYETPFLKLNARLPQIKSDTARMNLLNSLVLNVRYNNDPSDIDTSYINQIIKLNNRAHLTSNIPYQLLLQGVLACRKRDYNKSLVIFKQTELELNKANIDPLNLLLSMRWIFTVVNKQEDKYDYYTKRLNYYLQSGQSLSAGGCYHCLAGYYAYKGNYSMAINSYLKAGEIFKRYTSFWHINEILNVGIDYGYWGNLDKSLFYLKKGYQLLKRESIHDDISYALTGIAQILYTKSYYRQSLKYLDTLETLEASPPDNQDPSLHILKALNLTALNRLPEALKDLQLAQKYGDTSKMYSASNSPISPIEMAFYKYYHASGYNTKAEQSLLTGYGKAGIAGLRLEYLGEMIKFYGERKNIPTAWKYSELYKKLNDSLESNANNYKIAPYEIEQKENAQNKEVIQLQQQHAVQEATIGQRNIIIWLSLAGLAAVCVLVVFIYRQLQVNKRTLKTLQQTQTQLIQSEKMASLGELTAGIAHEIQNPLNFVNNFSEVSVELINELKEEQKAGNADEVLAIADDLTQNLEKINHHGKRADFIVKGMLQHSRTSTGEKQLTDINVLADEFLKLSYHGLRAKDKSFNAELVTHFDENLPKVKIAQQDIGRVLLNLFNNAFYAVNQKQKKAGSDYKPEVTVSTSIQKNSLVISVRDNGNGIAEAIKDKIMQPFFTTKPTGEGTGLGLSLSYDIVVKGHGGKIVVDSNEGEGSEFIITLPVS